MIPVVTPDEMRAIDAAAPEPVEELIRRAGSAVAHAAVNVLGGTYGRVVNVIAGVGNNGADGRDAARRLAARGVKVRVFDAATCPPVLPRADLVIDAAYGTGFRPTVDRVWKAPDVGDALVLAVDIPSGLDASTGVVGGSRVLRADRTVTFQAFKPGLLFGSGPQLSGRIDVVDIGLDVSASSCHLVERSDVAAWWPSRRLDAHKWTSAVRIVAGSATMPGAAVLCAAAAARGGSGLVSLATPGARTVARPEIVHHDIPAADFSDAALRHIDRFAAMVIGPGLGRDDGVVRSVRHCVVDAAVPLVVDGDALFAIGTGLGQLLRRRAHPTVLTPHDGEFGIVTGARPGDDRIEATRRLSLDTGTTVLLKGPTTVVATPDSAHETSCRVWLVDRGDQRLATAGTGDVLAGLIASALAGGLDAGRAAAAGAWLHAAAADLGADRGLLAEDIIDLIPDAIDALS